MIGEVIANTNVIRYLMAAMGILGVIAKLVNQVTLNRLIRAAGTMSKSTHRLIKLVKAKYEHACMVHDTVENTDAFVEKYIYEYRGFLFKIHTWRQIEILTVWFSGILALLGASADYLYYGAVESVYQYIAVGAAEMILLEVIRRMSDEPYKIHGVKMYMIDYLDNTCAVRQRRQRVTEKEELNVIASANYGAAEQPEKKEETVAAKPEVRGRKRFRTKNCSESSVRNRWNFQSILKVNHVGLSRKWNQVQDMTESQSEKREPSQAERRIP